MAMDGSLDELVGIQAETPPAEKKGPGQSGDPPPLRGDDCHQERLAAAPVRLSVCGDLCLPLCCHLRPDEPPPLASSEGDLPSLLQTPPPRPSRALGAVSFLWLTGGLPLAACRVLVMVDQGLGAPGPQALAFQVSAVSQGLAQHLQGQAAVPGLVLGQPQVLYKVLKVKARGVVPGEDLLPQGVQLAASGRPCGRAPRSFPRPVPWPGRSQGLTQAGEGAAIMIWLASLACWPQ